MRTLRFIINPMNVVDLVAFAPFWILGGMDDPPFAVPSLDSPGGSAFGFVRAIRLVRVFRVFKMGKSSSGMPQPRAHTRTHTHMPHAHMHMHTPSILLPTERPSHRMCAPPSPPTPPQA